MDHCCPLWHVGGVVACEKYVHFQRQHRGGWDGACPMTGRVYCADGSSLALPTLLSWSLTQTDGEPCGCYTVEFLTDVAWGRSIFQGATLQLGENNVTYFTGVVDEVGFSVGVGGWTGTIYGRDMAGWLLDNEACATEFVTAYLDDILTNYVTPWGITSVRADDISPVSGYYVSSGESCWRALEGFCRHGGDICPRFLADGTLAIGYGSGDTHQITNSASVLSLDWQYNLADEISQIVEVDLVRSAVTNHLNEQWEGGGNRQQVMLSTTRTTAASWKTAGQRIAESQKERVVLTVKLAGRWNVSPLDYAVVSLTQWGISGNFTVVEVTNTCKNRAETTTLVLRGM
ncbi:MAG: hypothetical protein R3Y62_00910 [Eubacteriales bacterium]